MPVSWRVLEHFSHRQWTTSPLYGASHWLLHLIYLSLGFPNSQTAWLSPPAWRSTLMCFHGVCCAGNPLVVFFVLVLNFMRIMNLDLILLLSMGGFREPVWHRPQKFFDLQLGSPRLYWQPGLANPGFSLLLFISVIYLLKSEHHLPFLLPCRFFRSPLFQCLLPTGKLSSK